VTEHGTRLTTTCRSAATRAGKGNFTLVFGLNMGELQPGRARADGTIGRIPCQLEATATLQEWRPVIERNLERLRGSVTGQPHNRNLDRWQSLVRHGDVPGLHRVLTGLDRDSIEMREVSPMGGLLPQDERQAALREAD
jgi:hypothetical protein